MFGRQLFAGVAEFAASGIAHGDKTQALTCVSRLYGLRQIVTTASLRRFA